MDSIDLVPILVAMSNVATEGEVVETIQEKYTLILPSCVIKHMSLIACDVVCKDPVIRGELCY